MVVVASVLVALYLFPDAALIFQLFLINFIPVSFFVGLIAFVTGSLLMHPAGKAITAVYGAAMLAVAVVVPSVVPLARMLFLTKAMVLVPLLAGILLLLMAPFHRRWWS